MSVQVIGNGKIFAAYTEAEIIGVSEFSLPFLCSLSPEGEYGIISSRSSGSTAIYRQLSNAKGRRCEIVDFTNDCALVRSVLTYSPLYFKLILPPYVKLDFFNSLNLKRNSYQCLMLRIPRGIEFYEGAATEREMRMLIILRGEAKFIQDERRIVFGNGRSDMIFVAATADDIISTASSVIPKIENAFVEIPEDKYAMAAEKALRFIFGDKSPYYRCAAEVLTENMLTVACHISSDGGLISGYDRPVVCINELPEAGIAAITAGISSIAKNILSFIFGKYKRFGNIRVFEFAGDSDIRADDRGNYPPIYAGIALLAFEYYNIMKTDMQSEAVKVLREIFIEIQDSIVFDTLPFSGEERYFRKDVIPNDILTQGSSVATARYLDAVSKAKKYCCDRGMTEESFGINSALYEIVKQKFSERFIKNNKIYLNCPMRAGKISPKSIYGSCPACGNLFPYRGWLIKSCAGKYVCPTCAAEGKTGGSDPAMRYFFSGAASYCAGVLKKIGVVNEEAYRMLIKSTMPEDISATPTTELALLASEISSNSMYDKCSEKLMIEILSRSNRGSISQYRNGIVRPDTYVSSTVIRAIAVFFGKRK